MIGFVCKVQVNKAGSGMFARRVALNACIWSRQTCILFICFVHLNCCKLRFSEPSAVFCCCCWRCLPAVLLLLLSQQVSCWARSCCSTSGCLPGMPSCHQQQHRLQIQLLLLLLWMMAAGAATCLGLTASGGAAREAAAAASTAASSGARRLTTHAQQQQQQRLEVPQLLVTLVTSPVT